MRRFREEAKRKMQEAAKAKTEEDTVCVYVCARVCIVRCIKMHGTFVVYWELPFFVDLRLVTLSHMTESFCAFAIDRYRLCAVRVSPFWFSCLCRLAVHCFFVGIIINATCTVTSRLVSSGSALNRHLCWSTPGLNHVFEQIGCW